MTAFLFSGDCLVLPSGSDGSGQTDNPCVSKALIEESFDSGSLEYFEVPSLDRGTVYSCCMLVKKNEIPASWRLVSVRELASSGSITDSATAQNLLRCCHIMQWRTQSAFCGSCGSRNNDSPKELSRVCPVCGRTEYPRISPAIIVRITDSEDRILLAHNRTFKSGFYSLIAGFSEAGEKLEDTVRREVGEEVGLQISDIRYVSSQSWPFPNSLMIGWTACHSGGTIHCDGKEIDDAHWFTRENLPPLPGKGSIARYLIDKWL